VIKVHLSDHTVAIEQEVVDDMNAEVLAPEFLQRFERFSYIEA